MSEKIKLGVIGTGMAWERLHWPALQRLSAQYEITALCDKIIEKAKPFANAIGLSEEHVYSDYHRMISEEKPDAVDLLVPISENFEVGMDVLRAGIPFIAEKPFAGTPQAARKLIALSEEKGIPVLVAENFRYCKENQIIKETIDSGVLGKAVSFLQCTGADFEKEQMQDNFSAKEWRQHPVFPGGIFLDGGIHDIARMRYLFGDGKVLHAAGIPQDKEYCPYFAIHALLRFKGGLIGQYAYFSGSGELTKPPMGMRIFCERGEIFLESKTCGRVLVQHQDGKVEIRPFTPEQGYYGELLNFWRALRKGEPIVSTPEKELGDIEMIDEILRLAQKE